MVVNLRNTLKGIALACPFYFLSICILVGQDLSGQIIWENGKAIGLNVPEGINEGEKYDFTIFLQGSNTAVLGSWKNDNNWYRFYPAIPFTFGLSYKLQQRGETVGWFTIPSPAEREAPKVLEIYPSCKVVPENMLKIHVRFSEPMQEGQAIRYIQLVNEQGDIVPQVFLNLQPELWNADQTMLTLWLDPGRIKRDLQPNLKMGAPLLVGNSYSLMISDDWKSQQGLNLKETYSKEYLVGEVDRMSPDAHRWQITYPPVNSRKAIVIDFGETLDATLAESAIQVMHGGEPVSGIATLRANETGWGFVPEASWEPGEYQLMVETRLEDLAGNNLNRLFDRDLLTSDNESLEEGHISIPFSLTTISSP